MFSLCHAIIGPGQSGPPDYFELPKVVLERTTLGTTFGIPKLVL